MGSSGWLSVGRAAVTRNHRALPRTHGRLSRPWKVIFQCQQLPVGPRSPAVGLRVVLGGSAYSKMGMFWGFCRGEERRGGGGAGDVGEGHAGVWLGDRGVMLLP